MTFYVIAALVGILMGVLSCYAFLYFKHHAQNFDYTLNIIKGDLENLHIKFERLFSKST